MNNHIDPTSDRLFCHMAWANAQLFTILQRLPDAVLHYTELGNEWTVAMTLHHLVEAAMYLAKSLEGNAGVLTAPTSLPPTRISELDALAKVCAGADARLHLAAHTPAGVVTRSNDFASNRARTTVLAQAIHHATEHRAQIAGALVANGVTALSLDDLDVRAFGDAEGLVA